MLFCSGRTVVSMLNVEQNVHPREVFKVNSPIVALTAEVRFKCCVVGTANNVITVFDMRKERETAEFDCGEPISDIMITNSFGLIIVRTFKNIILLTIDGKFIKSAPLPADIVNWWQMTTPSGIDYIAFHDNENKVGFFESFYPEKITRFFETRSRVCLITLDVLHECFVIMTHNGLVQFCNVPLE